MRRYIQIIETAEAGSEANFYHTTSSANARLILAQKRIRANNNSNSGYVSFSEVPLIGNSNIAASEVSIGFRRSLMTQLEKVEYTERWFNQNYDKAAYVAGEGWYHQWEPPDDAFDDEGNEDEDVYNAARRAAELSAFLDMANEAEWVSRTEYAEITFQPSDVMVLVVVDPADWFNELARIGYGHVQIGGFSKRR